MGIQLVWLKRDLRLDDHRALAKANRQIKMHLRLFLLMSLMR